MSFFTNSTFAGKKGGTFGCLFLWPTVPTAGYFLLAQKVTKKAPAPTDSGPPFMHPVIVFAIPGLLSGYRVLAFDVPFAGRPLFFIQEKKRRPPSSLKTGGYLKIKWPLHSHRIKH